jgi:hypothetical protein
LKQTAKIIKKYDLRGAIFELTIFCVAPWRDYAIIKLSTFSSTKLNPSNYQILEHIVACVFIFHKRRNCYFL